MHLAGSNLFVGQNTTTSEWQSSRDGVRAKWGA
jgi:hypothetical protein